MLLQKVAMYVHNYVAKKEIVAMFLKWEINLYYGYFIAVSDAYLCFSTGTC